MKTISVRLSRAALSPALGWLKPMLNIDDACWTRIVHVVHVASEDLA